MSTAGEMRRRKIIKIFIIIFVVLDLIVSVVYISNKYRICKEDVVSNELNNYQRIANDNLENMIHALDTLVACFETNQNWTLEEQIQIMKAFQKAHGFDYVVRTEADGYAVNMDGKTGIYLGDRAYFLAGMNGKTTTNFISQGKVDSANSFIISAVPIKNNGKAIGIVHGSYSVDHYFNNISVSTKEKDEMIMLIDTDGNIVASLDNKGENKNLSGYGIDDKDLSEIKKTVASKTTGNFNYKINGTDYAVSFVSADFYKTDLSFVVARKSNQIPVETDQLLDKILSFLIINGALWVIWVISLVYLINRKRAEQETRRLNAIISNIPTGIMVYRVDEKDVSIVECSSIALQMFGLTKDVVIGSKNEELLRPIHQEDQGIAREMIRELSINNVTKTFDYRVYNRNEQRYIWLRANAHSVIRRDRTVYIYISYTDITEQKKTEALRVELEATKSANVAKSRFLSRMSHEIRTPINAIMGIAELMKQDVESNSIKVDELEKYSNDTIVASKYLLTLVNDVLDTAKIESNQIEIQQHPVNVESYLADVKTLMEPLVKEKNIHFIFERKTKMHETYIGDGIRVKQILVNLLNNAIKFTPPGGTVSLTSEAVSEKDNKTTLQFTISDNGIGMSEEFQQKLFTPFAQENNDNTSPFEGSGLGLSIARSLAQKMGGDILCASQKGKGTTFLVSIVVGFTDEEIEPNVVREADIDNSIQEFPGVRILVCEDHPLNQKITKALLERRKCIVEIAADGVIGVDMFEKSPIGYYNMILMDIRMPNMDGLQATREIRSLDRSDAKSVAIVAMSANAFDDDVQQSLKAGMNEHLAKPVDAAKLYAALGKYTK